MTEAKKQEASLVQKLARIQRELKAPKNQYNSFGKYNYRNCEDIMEAVKPFLDDLILIVSDDIFQAGERYYVKATASLIDNNEKVISNTAFAREADIKTGMDSAQITGAASSYARKYALNGLFAIDDTKDADSQDNTPKKPAPTAKPKPTEKVITQNVATEMYDDAIPENILNELDGKVPDKPLVHYGEENGEVARNRRGHTACISCGKEVSERVEKYSLDQYGKVLCVPCQSKEKAKGKK